VLGSSTNSVRPECVNPLNSVESTAADTNLPDGIRKKAQANLAWNGSYDGLAGVHKDVMLIVGTNDTQTLDQCLGTDSRSDQWIVDSCASRESLMPESVLPLWNTGSRS